MVCSSCSWTNGKLIETIEVSVCGLYELKCHLTCSASPIFLRWLMLRSPIRMRPLVWFGWYRSSCSSTGTASRGRARSLTSISARLNSAPRKSGFFCNTTGRGGVSQVKTRMGSFITVFILHVLSSSTPSPPFCM